MTDREKQRVFFDLDGVLCVFNTSATEVDLHTRGYFRTLAPMDNVVSAAKILCKTDFLDVFILSAVLIDNPYVQNEKSSWIDQYLPEIALDHRIFPPCNENKSLYVPGGITRSDVLIDDYTVNLLAWGGHAVKLLNGINHTKGTWNKAMISYTDDPKSLANKIISICLSGKE